ncbi:MAG TPA: GNAT family N-acetyltransferase [Devosiaceae bacterium]
MGLLADYRARGIGRALLEATLDDAFARGFERVALEVFAGNERAVRLYEKVGFLH